MEASLGKEHQEFSFGQYDACDIGHPRGYYYVGKMITIYNEVVDMILWREVHVRDIIQRW